MHAQSTIAEIDLELAAGTVTLAEAHAVLQPRSTRPNSRSALRAAEWIKSHPLPQVKPATTRKAAKVAPTTKQLAAEYATFKAVRGSAAWWTAYRTYTAAARARKAA